MSEHVHTGPTAIVVAGLSALLIFNLLRLGAAWLVAHDHSGSGEAIGALVSFN